MSQLIANILATDAYNVVSMTEATKIMPYVSSTFESAIPWDVDTSLTPDVVADRESDKIYVLPTIPRGAPPPRASREQRGMIRFPIPRYAEIDSVENLSLLGVRETGSTAPRNLVEFRNKRLKMLLARQMHTADFVRACALKGLVPDQNGATVIDWFSVTGEDKLTGTLDLSKATTKPNEWFQFFKEMTYDILGDGEIPFWTAIAGRDAYRWVHANKYVRESYFDMTNPSWLRQFLGNAQPGSGQKAPITLADDVSFVWGGRALAAGRGSNNFIDPDKIYLVPNISDFAHTIYGPSTMTEYWDNPQPIYAKAREMEWDAGIEMLVEQYIACWFDRPGCVMEITVTPPDENEPNVPGGSSAPSNIVI